jgi:hypothetical protein
MKLFDKPIEEEAEEQADAFLDNIYLITSTYTGESMLWAMSGAFVGQFGGRQASRWELSRPHTWPNRWLMDGDHAHSSQTETAKRAAASSVLLPVQQRVRSVIADYINGNSRSARLRSGGGSGLSTSEATPSIAVRSTDEQALWELQQQAKTNKAAKLAAADGVSLSASASGGGTYKSDLLNDEVRKLTKIVFQSKAPNSAKHTESYQHVNRAHPVIDVEGMPLPFDSPRVEGFHRQFRQELERRDQSPRKKKL